MLKMNKQKEHSEQKFKNFYNDFNLNIIKKNSIKLLYSEEHNIFLVEDGVHRLSIMLHKKIITDDIPLEYLNITYDNKIVNNIKNKLHDTTLKGHYNKWKNTDKCYVGYHSFNFGNVTLKGQRNPLIRLKSFKTVFDFTNKNVVDFGCNTGGMLHHLPEINNGLGFDYDIKCINAAKHLSNIIKYNNTLLFKQHDFDKNSYQDLKNKITFKPDIIFLLSLGSWIKSWKELYKTALSYKCPIILEINNEKEGVSQLQFFKNNNKNLKLIINNSLDDCTNNNRRRTYIIL